MSNEKIIYQIARYSGASRHPISIKEVKKFGKENANPIWTGKLILSIKLANRQRLVLVVAVGKTKSIPKECSSALGSVYVLPPD